MKLNISYVLRYAVLKPMGVVFLGHKVVYESKSILPSISRCFPLLFAVLKCAHIQKDGMSFTSNLIHNNKWQIKCI